MNSGCGGFKAIIQTVENIDSVCKTWDVDSIFANKTMQFHTKSKIGINTAVENISSSLY